jgi:peptidoglycan/LPS O-acetylase OafA/YrhL
MKKWITLIGSVFLVLSAFLLFADNSITINKTLYFLNAKLIPILYSAYIIKKEEKDKKLKPTLWTILIYYVLTTIIDFYICLGESSEINIIKSVYLCIFTLLVLLLTYSITYLKSKDFYIKGKNE